MNPLDIAIVALCAAFGLLGLLRGFVRQAASLAGLVLGHIVGVKYNAAVQKVLRFDFSHGDIAAYLITLLAVYIAVRLIGLLVERWVRETKLSGTDRFLGLIAGSAKGILLSILLVFVLVIFLPRDASLFRGSKLFPRAMAAAGLLTRAFPERIGDAFREKLRVPEPAAPKAGEGDREQPPPPQRKKRSRK